MATKLIGLSRDLIIHPGETLRELLEDRDMTQKELAKRTDFSEKHISKVLNGQASITSKFAAALAVVFDVNAIFWINLQGNYDLELAEFNALNSISPAEISILSELKDVVRYMKKSGLLTDGLKPEEDVLQMRNILSVNNLTIIPSLSFSAVFRGSATHKINLYVLFAWIRLCEILAAKVSTTGVLDKQKLKSNIPYIKSLMFKDISGIRKELDRTFSDCGIKLCIVKHFTGAPVQGFIERANSGDIVLCMTIRNAWADIFWFTLFHEIAHILNDDVSNRFIDYSFTENEAERKANEFAEDILIDPDNYKSFVKAGDFSLVRIRDFAKHEQVKPYIVIGRLQREHMLQYQAFSGEKVRYKWTEE